MHDDELVFGGHSFRTILDDVLDNSVVICLGPRSVAEDWLS